MRDFVADGEADDSDTDWGIVVSGCVSVDYSDIVSGCVGRGTECGVVE